MVSAIVPSFEDLACHVQSCFSCRHMNYVHVLGEANGPAPALVMFVGEAPRRLGAARAGAPVPPPRPARFPASPRRGTHTALVRAHAGLPVPPLAADGGQAAVRAADGGLPGAGGGPRWAAGG